MPMQTLAPVAAPPDAPPARTPQQRDQELRDTRVETWGDFKSAVEAYGVADGTPLDFIEFGAGVPIGVCRKVTRVVDVSYDEPDGVQIREAR